MLENLPTDEEKTWGIRNVVALQKDTEHSIDRASKADRSKNVTKQKRDERFRIGAFFNFIFVRLLKFYHFFTLSDADERCICETYQVDNFLDSFINWFNVDTPWREDGVILRVTDYWNKHHSAEW